MGETKQPEKLLLEDEALRDGLQIESKILTIDQKIDFFNLLKNAGVKRIQVGSFVHPKIVPQMADSDELIKTLGKQTDPILSALILNSRGLDRALACGVPHVSMSVSISDTHSQKNARRSAADALSSMIGLINNARVQGYGSLLILFHVMVRTMTGLNFRYHMAALFIFLVLPLFLSLIKKVPQPEDL